MGESVANGKSGTIEGSELRRMLRSCELAVANLKGLGPGALDLLRTLDKVTEGQETLRTLGMDVRSEETRLQGIEGVLRGKVGVLLRELRVVGGLGAACAAQAPLPPESHWWWYLDIAHKKQQQSRLRRSLGLAAIVVAVLGLAVLAYDRLVPRDPRLEAKFGHIAVAERSLEEGDADTALAEYEAARALDPGDPEVLVWLGVLYEMQERVGEAEAVLAEAERLAGDRAEFLVMRGFCYGQLGNVEKALADGKDAATLNPDLPQAHLVQAGAYETMGDVGRALEELEVTAQLAQKAGSDTLYVIAKTRQALLMQRGVAGMSPPEQTVEE